MIAFQSYCQTYTFPKNNEKAGLRIESSRSTQMQLSFAIDQFQLNDIITEDILMKELVWGSAMLPGEEGAPQLPSITKNLIIPQGSTVDISIVNSQEQIYENILISPCPKTPTNSKDIFYPAKRGAVYSKDELYPREPISYHLTEIRGMQVLVLNLMPFQYNPVTKQLLVQSQMNIEINILSYIHIPLYRWKSFRWHIQSTIIIYWLFANQYSSCMNTTHIRISQHKLS